MTVMGLQNVHFVVRDVGRAVDFWQGAIGLSLRFRDADRWVQMKAVGDSFALASPEEGHPGQKGAIPVFEVDELESHAEAIVQGGGALLAERDMGEHGRVLTFSDPDGNVAQLFNRK
jgi:predicted enzyme related to lactoylglutathione lyase